MIIAYPLILIALFIYSYSLVDPNITFFNNSIWTNFRNEMVQLGYYHRDLSMLIYLGIILVLYFLYFVVLKRYQQYNPILLSIIVAACLVLSYPFLSHDFLKYLFDAKILTLYHQNPYIHKPMEFQGDQWLRFMQWVHQPYRYGPVFLFLMALPSFLSMGKLILSFVFTKILFSLFYIFAVVILEKMNRKWALMFALNPLVLIEGLVNSHNDIIALALGIITVYFFLQNNRGRSIISAFLSIGIKYLTLPILFLSKNKYSWLNALIFVAILFLPFLFLSPYFSHIFQIELQSWYFLALFIFVPFYEKLILKLNIFFFGLLLSYYPYIRLGGWDSPQKVQLKLQIIVVAFVLNLLYLVFIFWKEKKKGDFLKDEVLS